MKSEILWVLKNTPFIITNSEDVTAAVGDKVKYTLKVSGGSGSYEYRWFLSTDDGKTWKKSSYSGSKKDTASFTVTEAMYTYKFRCRIIDSATGKEYYSNVMTVKALEPEGFIKTQPKDYQVKVGESAIYTVEVNGKAKRCPPVTRRAALVLYFPNMVKY